MRICTHIKILLSSSYEYFDVHNNFNTLLITVFLLSGTSAANETSATSGTSAASGTSATSGTSAASGNTLTCTIISTHSNNCILSRWDRSSQWDLNSQLVPSPAARTAASGTSPDNLDGASKLLYLKELGWFSQPQTHWLLRSHLIRIQLLECVEVIVLLKVFIGRRQ